MGNSMRLLLAVSCCAILASCGSGREAGIDIAPVSGRITLDGQPLANPVVTFYPDKGPVGVGVGDASGAFTVRTNGQDGAPIGKCKVTVVQASADTSASTDGNEAAMVDQSAINPIFMVKGSTPLTVDVPAEGLESLDLGVTGPTKKK